MGIARPMEEQRSIRMPYVLISRENWLSRMLWEVIASAGDAADEPDQAARTRARRSAIAARPYPWRLMSFTLWM